MRRPLSTECLCALAAGAGCLWPLSAPGQARVGTRLPGGQQVTVERGTEDRQEKIDRMRRRCRTCLGYAREHIDDQQWVRALEDLRDAQANAVTRPLARRIAELKLEVDREGRRRLAEADELYKQEKYVEAVQAYERISRTFGELPSGKGARARLGRAESDPAVQSALAEVKAARLDQVADNIIEGYFRRQEAEPQQEAGAPETRPAEPPDVAETRVERIKRLPTDLQVRVYGLLDRLAEHFAEAPSGQRAAGDLEALRSDSEFLAALKDYQAAEAARRLFQRAKAYRQAGLLRKARDLYSQLIKEHPDSEYAEKAETKLPALKARIKVTPPRRR